MTECPSGLKLTTNNETIVNCILELKTQYQDMYLLLKNQEEERAKLQMEMDAIAYKLALVNSKTGKVPKIRLNRTYFS